MEKNKTKQKEINQEHDIREPREFPQLEKTFVYS